MMPEKPIGSMFTDEQWHAIHAKGKNVIVSAGAGSGKTSVLTERVMRILEDGHPVTSLLVLTFTKAAAEEMRERIRKALKKRISKGSLSLKENLEDLDGAMIGTFDSFCLQLVKKHNTVLNLPKHVRIGDPVLFGMAEDTILEDLVEDALRKRNQGVLDYLRTFTSKGPDKLKRQISDLRNLLLKQNLGASFIEQFPETHPVDAMVKVTLEGLQEEITRLASSLRRTCRNMNAHAFVSEEAYMTVDAWNGITEGYLGASRLDEFRALASPRRFTVVKGTDDTDKEVLGSYKDKIKKILEKIDALAAHDEASVRHDHELMRPHLLTLLFLTGTFIRRMWDHMFTHHIFDFQSIQILALDLIGNHPGIKEEIRNTYHEILVDEYQDTSYLQQTLINMISQDNVFMVGDVKQSIYRFRDAVPKLFKETYDEARLDPEKGIAIDLNRNFRSRRDVIDDLNALFSLTMDSDVGGVDYDDTQALIHGNTAYDDASDPDGTYGIRTLAPDIQGIKESYDMSRGHQERPLRDSDIQALVVARDIKTMIGRGRTVMDKDSNRKRPMRFDDIVVLIDRKKDFTTFKSVFESMDIPSHVHADRPFVDNDDILAVRGMLQMVRCFIDHDYAKSRFRHVFASLFRSFVFSTDDDTIARVLVSDAGKKAWMTDIRHVTGNTVVADAMDAFEGFARQSPVMSTGRMLMEMIGRFNVFERSISLGSVRQTEERLFFLIGKVEELSDAGFTLSDVIDYVDHVVDNGLDIDYAGATSLVSGVVNIMTIHKSKGLEFPVVYCPLLETRWRSGDASSVRFDQNHGVIIPVFDEGVKDPVETTLMTTRDRRDNISERLRLLYVALTRAREQVVLVMDENPDEPLSPVLPTEPVDLGERENYTSFADVIRSASGAVMRHTRRIGWNPELFGSGHLARLKEHQAIPKSDMTITYRTLDISHDEPSNTRFSMTTPSIPSVEDTKMIALGTDVHAALESLDFRKDLEEEIRTKVGDPRVRAILSSVKDWPFLSDMENARVMKEHAFVFNENGTHRHGVIDLLIERKTSVIILDYKLKDISKDAYMDQVRGYMDYARAMFKKEVRGYLWSILDGTLKEVT